MNPLSNAAPRASGVDPARTGWLLFSAALALCWLLPSRFPPWRTFDGEFTAFAVAGVLLAVVVLGSGPRPWHWPAAALAALAVAVLPWLQWAAGLLTFRGDAVIASSYLAGLALAIVLGHRLAASPRQALPFVDALMTAIGLAAVLSAAMALLQWLRLQPLFGDFISVLHPGMRPYANLGQPNQLATLLGWGLVALWWGWLRRGLPAAAATGLAALLLAGIAATQSRSAWLFLALAWPALAFLRAPLRLQAARGVVAALALGFVVLVASWEWIDQALGLQVASPLAERLQGGLRTIHWATLLDALWQRPLTGYGWNQLQAAQQAAMLDHPSTRENLDHAHNLVLDLLIWNGIPLGAAIAAAGAAWWWRAARLARRHAEVPAIAVLWMAVSIAAVHAMLEYPHSYGFFLVPAGLMVGAISGLAAAAAGSAGAAPTPRRTAFAGLAVPRVAMVGVALAAFGLVVAIHHDYRNARALLEAWRLEVLALANPNPFPGGVKPRLWLLDQVAAQLDPPRAQPGQVPTPQQLQTLRRYSQRFSVGTSLLEYAKAQAQSGDLDGARQSLQRMCSLIGPEECDKLRAQWRMLAGGQWPELAPVRF